MQVCLTLQPGISRIHSSFNTLRDLESETGQQLLQSYTFTSHESYALLSHS